MYVRLLETGPLLPEENMAVDAALLKNASQEKEPVLRFYQWVGDCATYGYFIDPAQFFHLDAVEKAGLHLARRPTGGGILFHFCDLAFSLMVPAHCAAYSSHPQENYARVNGRVLEAIQGFQKGVFSLELKAPVKFGYHRSQDYFCMAHPTTYDVIWQGYKVGGAAQRRTKEGFLHQGSISLALPERGYLEQVLKEGALLSEAMQSKGGALLGASYSPQELQSARAELQQLLNQAFLQRL